VVTVSKERTGALRVLTLNTAHGRSRGWHQTLQRNGRIKEQVDQIADLIARESADVVALQETDAPSVWSGRFDHPQAIAERAGLPFRVHGAHVDGPRLSYGTALLANRPLDDFVSHRFRRSPPTPTKGFVVATVDYAGRPLDVVSLHLDFSRAGIRRRQLHDLVHTLRDRERAVVVMGDFNCRWTGREKTLHALCDQLGLHTWRVDADDLGTFHRGDARLDWVFASEALEFGGYETLADEVSDHLAVVASVRWAR
jgi:endonuclease/exonuclease/phosphatase family metal-dependent hydrolase